MLLKRICWFLAVLLTASAPLLAQPTIEEGKSLFTANCAACHAKDMKSKLTGPALAGMEERWADYPREDLYAWIRNSQALIATGHPRATELWNEWKLTLMNNFPGLTDDQIEGIILYVNDVAVNGGGPKLPPGSKPPVEKNLQTSGSSSAWP